MTGLIWFVAGILVGSFISILAIALLEINRGD